MKAPSLFFIAALALAACGGDNTGSKVDSPGNPQTAETKALEAGAAVLQEKTPIGKLNAYLDGFHFYNGRMEGQMEAHHYCGHLNEEVIQCVIYDGNGELAKIMGVEYIISKRLFVTLPPEEKHLWHSHAHEVRSGELIAPGIPEAAEHELMEKLAGTYGKTWHTWHTDMNKELPLGAPMLMMGFTADGQIDPSVVQARDARFQVASEDKKRKRADIEYPPVDPEADAWQKDTVLQIITEQLKGPLRIDHK